jgi:hypothetical protein
MVRPVERSDPLEVWNEQQSLDGLVKRVRKLRWIGRVEDAEQAKFDLIRTALNGAVVPSFAPGDTAPPVDLNMGSETASPSGQVPQRASVDRLSNAGGSRRNS